jgi:hypothetical protein
MLKIVSTPPASGRNRFYVSNREPLLPNPLVKLPVGSVRPKGWLRQQPLLMADGMTGYLPETSQWCQFKGSAWASAEGQGDYGWEEVPYWLRGFGDLRYVFGDERIVAETRRWVEAVLSSQEQDGYFGPRVNKENNDLWPNMLMLDVLKSFHEATGEWRQEANGLVGLLPDSPIQSGELVETITLIPMGCARLRIAAFATVG